MKMHRAYQIVWKLFVVGMLGWGVSATAQTTTLINSVGTGTLRNNFNGTVGYDFTVGATALYASELGFYDDGNDGLAVGHPVGLWDSSGSLVATATVSAGTGPKLASGFRWAMLTTPLLLPSNATYRIGALVNASDKWRDANGGATLDTSIVSATWASRHDNGGSSTLTYPFNGFAANGFIAPNAGFTANPRQYRIAPLNAGFENATLTDGADTTATPNGWVKGSGGNTFTGTLNPNSSMYADGNAPEGNNVLYAYSVGSGQPDAVAAQILGATLQSGYVYTLTVKVGDRLDTANNGYAVRLGYGDSFGTFTLLAEDNNGQTLPNGGWVTSTVAFTNLTAIAQPLQIQLVGKNGTGFGNQVDFDDVSLTTTLIPRGTLIWVE